MIECPNCHTTYDTPVAFCGTCGTGIDADRNPADPLIGMVIDGRYRIIDLIGRGGMGAVYRVEHVKMGKIVAMKLLHGELSSNVDVSKRFRREAETVSQLSHIHTVSVFDFGSHQGMMYLVMEYIEGRDLSDVLRSEGAFSPLRVVDILAQVCSALREAHSKGIIHRDLKPENIIVTQSQDRKDFVKVLDFGLAKLRHQQHGTKITQQGSLVGTPYYMAPEHIRGEDVDARSDIYALGAVMFKLLTGETPFTADTPMGIITKHLTEDVRAPSLSFPDLSIPKVLDEIVLKAMSRDPKNRYKSAEEMRKALVKAHDSIVESSRSMSLKVESNETPVMEDLPDSMPRRPDTKETPLLANLGKTGPRTITVGQREMSIGTRSEVLNFETGFRRRRWLQVVILVLILLCIVGGGVYWYLFHFRDDSDPTRETEPNDLPTQADTLTSTVQLVGTIAGDGANGDVDWYRLAGPKQGDWAVEVTVTGIAGADLAIQLVDPSNPEPLAAINSNGVGFGEVVYPTVVSQPSVYLMVQEVRRPGVPPGNFPTVPYGVNYSMFDPSSVEREPNNTSSKSTPAKLGMPLQGRLISGEDVDWYCVPAGMPVQLIQVSGAAAVDLQLELLVGTDGKKHIINNGLAGLGESASIPVGTGPVCAAVERASNSQVDSVRDWPASPYQIVFQ